MVIADLCDWDTTTNSLSKTECDAMTGSFASGQTNSWGEAPYDTVWDYSRVMRGTATNDISSAQGVEQHELGHVFGLAHHDKCLDIDNPMFRSYTGNGCGSSTNYRLGGYDNWTQEAWDAQDMTKWGSWVNQIDVMVTEARTFAKISCN